jgi:hypothetical protein
VCEDDEDCARYGATLGAQKAVGCAGCNTSHVTLGGVCAESDGTDAMRCEKLCEASDTCRAYEWLGVESSVVAMPFYAKNEHLPRHARDKRRKG